MKSKEKKKNPAIMKGTVGIILLALMLMIQTGVFSTGKIPSGYVETPLPVPAQYKTSNAQQITVDRIYEEPAVVTTKVAADLSPQIMGVILSIEVTPGENVEKGQILVKIASEQMGAKVEQVQKSLSQAKSSKLQAEQNVLSAKAAFEQAQKEYERIQDFYKNSAATKVQLEAAEAQYKQAKAMLAYAEQGVKMASSEIEKAENFLKEAEIGLSYATISAPFDGIITRKMQNPGDMALPGKPILSLNNMNDVRLEAQVNEKLKDFLAVGQTVGISADNEHFNGTIEEIVPAVDPATRTFTVKAGFTPREKIFIGMYGKMLIPTTSQTIVAIDESALTQVGQLYSVLIKSEGNAYRRYVRPGSYRKNGMIEILSGLNGNEELIVEGE